MNKVKLTRKQAKELEYYKLRGEEQIDYLVNVHHNKLRPDLEISKLTTSEIAKALYIGYEIEEKFKVGDWVIESDTELACRITGITNVNGRISYGIEGRGYLLGDELIRLATPEEIAAEKERRWWAKHGRYVWELREGDCLIRRHNPHTCNVKFVEAADEDLILLVDGIRDETYETKNDLEVMKKKYEVFCFVEGRKDGRVNE